MTLIIAQLNHRIQPMDRGERYEDPLDEMLKAERLGEVTGGGTSMLENFEIEFADIEIDIQDTSEQSLSRVIACLEEAGAPKGSKIIIGENTVAKFGKLEGLALYMNGTDLSDEAYENGDINDVVEALDELLEGVSAFDDFWEGPTETALYAYGASFDEIRAIIEPYLAENPLCRLCRIVRIA